MAVSQADSGDPRKHVEITWPIHIPQPLHETLMDKKWLLVVRHLHRHGITVQLPDLQHPLLTHTLHRPTHNIFTVLTELIGNFTASPLTVTKHRNWRVLPWILNKHISPYRILQHSNIYMLFIFYNRQMYRFKFKLSDTGKSSGQRSLHHWGNTAALPGTSQV